MALGRGETVGTAFVRILADGTGLPESIRRELHDAEPDVEEAGGEHSEAYAKGWAKKAKANRKIEKSLRSTIDRAFGQMEADADSLRDGLERKIATGIQNGLDDGFDPRHSRLVAERIAKNMADSFSRTGVIPKNIRGQVDRALREIEQEAAQFEKRWRNITRQIDRDAALAFRNIGKESENVRNAFIRTDAAMFRLKDRIARDVIPSLRDVNRVTTAGRFRSLSKEVDKATDSFGRMFGKGSRNNAINFFGAIINGAINSIDFLFKFAAEIAKIGTDISTNFTKAGGGFRGVLAAAGPLVAQLGLLVVALIGIVEVAGLVASLISGIAGALTALASAVAFTLASGLGIIGALLLPLTATVGTLALAFTHLSTAMKKSLKESLKPVTSEFRSLQRIAARGILLGVKHSADDIAGAFRSLRPVVRLVAESLGDVLEGFARAANSPGAKQFLRQMGITLPGVIEQLGRITQNVFGGLAGLFEAALPSTQSFLDFLEQITGKFSRFTNSARGQNVLSDFFFRALETAGKLGRFLGRLGVAIGKVLFPEVGRRAGGTIIDDLTTKVNDFIRFLDQNPNAIRDFFAHGVETARSVGNLIREIVDAFKALDTPENRKNVHDLFDALTTGLDKAATGIKIAQTSFQILTFLIGQVFQIIHIDKFISILKLIPGAIDQVKSAFEGLKKKITDSLPHISLASLIDAKGLFHAITHPFSGHHKSILDALGKLNLKDIVSAVDLGITLRHPFFGRIPGILHALGKLHLKDIIDVGGIFKKILSFNWSDIPSAILHAIGGIDISPLFHFHLPKIPGLPHLATGGIFTGPQVRVIGEAGPEAVVPLNRPLNQVDPAVRALSAFAQGLPSPSSFGGNGRSINVGGLTIITPTKDPSAVARETINRMAAASY